jgi:hypothetical protein
MKQALTDGPLALPQSPNGLPEMAQLVACAVAIPSRNVHVTSVAVEGSLTVRRPCASDSRNQLDAAYSYFWRTEIPVVRPLLEVSVDIVKCRGSR